MAKPSPSSEKIAGIYTITCVASGQSYLGASVNIRPRWNQHRAKLLNHRHENQRLQAAYDAYGFDGLEFAVVEKVGCWQQLAERERFHFHQLKPGLNIRKPSGRGRFSSPEKAAKISVGVRLSAHQFTTEQRRKMGDANRRKTQEGTNAFARKGENHPGSKLTAADAREIKEMLRSGSLQAVIMARFGVCRETVRLIKVGKIWSHVE